MSNDGNDTLMRVVISGTNAVGAECQTEVSTDMDTYVWDYYNGEFFEIDTFRFNLKVTEDLKKTSDNVNPGQEKGTGQKQADLTRGSNSSQGRLGPSPVSGGGKGSKDDGVPGVNFSKWKSAKPADIKTMMQTMPYPIEMGEVVVDRTYDKASPVLFDYCCNSKTFASMSLIKRKDIGDKFLRGFLRIDFKEVLITSIEWKNGDVMKESFNFIFRKLEIQYRGSYYTEGVALANWQPQPTINWDYGADLKEQTAKS